MSNDKGNKGRSEAGDEFLSRTLRGWADKKSNHDDHDTPQHRDGEGEQLDRSRLQESDGRRLRATGRTEQFNIKVKPEWRAEVHALAQARQIGMASLLERMLAEWKALGGKAAQ